MTEIIQPNGSSDRALDFKLLSTEVGDSYNKYIIYEIENPENEREVFVRSTDRPTDYLTPIDEYEMSDYDRDVIQKGLDRLFTYISGCKELPTTIIFPDTSARPLFWSVKEGVGNEYVKRNLPFPKIVFLRTTSHFIVKGAKDDITSAEESVRGQKDAELIEKQIERLGTEDILNEDSNILVIDDYAHKGCGYRQIGKGIKAHVKPGNFSWFSFLGSEGVEEEEDMIVASRDTRKRPEMVRTGFDYASTILLRSNVTGVDKEGASVHIDKANMDKPSYFSRVLSGKEINRDIAVGFRRDLMQIGHDIAEKLRGQ